ncbi:MAG: 50S ribosomal protein L25 [Desulfobulbaceae bacterium]|jgi:large subunit ribosomal protein L25|nr:50S ribosomal protein L25 [Desulfobulbaceae bacterium]
MIQLDVTSQPRNTTGKGAARTLRRAGRTPAVLYGLNIEAMSLSIDTHSFTHSVLGLQRRNAVVNLTVEGGDTYQVFIKEMQVDPIHDTLKHADFYQIDAEKEYEFSVPLKYTGQAKGVFLGGELQIAQTKVKVKAKPMLVPDAIEIDLKNLAQGESISCEQLVLADGVNVLNPAKLILVSVV